LKRFWVDLGPLDRENFTRKRCKFYILIEQRLRLIFVSFPKKYQESLQTGSSRFLKLNFLARHARCDVYCGARETVGESSVSSGCWGEDSDHEYGWARRTPTFVAPIRFLIRSSQQISDKSRVLECMLPSEHCLVHSEYGRNRSLALQRLQISAPASSSKYEIIIDRGILSAAGTRIRQSSGREAQRLALVSNKNVFRLYGSTVVESLEGSGFQVYRWLMGDGERHKTLQTAEQALRFFADHGIERTDAVVALGGGVTGDLAGFAAAIYLRGIDCVQIPTTLVAQIDSSVGGKVGVNLAGGKNLGGAFHHPSVVIADLETLKTLPARELTAGCCECIKQGAIGSRRLFKQTVDYLSQFNAKPITISSTLENLIAAHVAFKASIVKTDPREDPARTDRRSRRILNFGHTVGHALEALTGYRRFRHGEAVGWGMLVAGELSKNLGLLDRSELELLQEGISLCGPLPTAANIDVAAILGAITRDKKSARDHIQWVLLERIGRPRIISGKEVDATSLRTSIQDALQKRS
jgi:3-dehydroquinate synthase